MIKKNFEVNVKSLAKNKFFLFYGVNEGAKKEKISQLFSKFNPLDINKYEETQIIENEKIFFEDIMSKSFFQKDRILIINYVTDKFLKIFEEIIEKKISDTTIILNAKILEKKSKLRAYFERGKDLICVPFYDDNQEVLLKIAISFFKENKILISRSDLNLVISKCNGDRELLKNELNKIKFFTHRGKKLTSDNISKLTNLVENHSLTDLIDNCLAKNKSKTVKILNENNFTVEDCIIIIRNLLSKAKKLLALIIKNEELKNIDLTIKNSKPPIFWKQIEITKQQINNWEIKDLKECIYEINDIELSMKKNFNNSLKLVVDFILQKSSHKSNN